MDSVPAPAPARSGWNLSCTYADLPSAFFVRQRPVPVARPQLVVLNGPLCAELGLDPEDLHTPDGVACLAGNALPPGATPLAQAYAGHQFGHFTMLGDGRAILLGEQVDPSGRRRDLQLKGSGRTPFSRGGDGRAALGPMLREVLIGEALHALGLPTTRGLAVVASGEQVYRETPLPGAVLTRVAASHLRVGTFQFAAARQDPALVHALVAYSLDRHDPEGRDAPCPARHLLEAVVRRQAALVARWTALGFVHGVMNTDNMAISGESIDFGPCAFVDTYDPQAVFSSIDRQGRYALGQQGRIAQWNLARLAEALLPALDPQVETAIAVANEVLAGFPALYEWEWLSYMRWRLGLVSGVRSGEEAKTEGDRLLVQGLLDHLQRLGRDYTNAFLDLERRLGPPVTPEHAPSDDDPSLAAWTVGWLARLDAQPGGRAAAADLMRTSNPRIIPRNHRVEEALAAACHGEWAPWETLLEAVRHPFGEHPGHASFRDPAPPAAQACYRTFCGT